VALEAPFVLMFLFFSLLLSLAAMAIVGFKLISSYQAMRDLSIGKAWGHCLIGHNSQAMIWTRRSSGGWLMSTFLRRLRRDQQGSSALETIFVFGFMMLVILIPAADLAVAGIQIIAAYEALRNLGERIQYSPPSDITNWSSWASSYSTVGSYAIKNFHVVCGAVDCDKDHTDPPRYYTYQTTVTLSPYLLTALCPSGTSPPCDRTVTYSERFE
jgi:hypothetical protein